MAFVKAARPDWYPPPQVYIPAPSMSWQQQVACRMKTMAVNKAYCYDGYVPVLHVGRYLDGIVAHDELGAKQRFAVGGLVPNLLRAPKALPCEEVIDDLRHVRRTLHDKDLHVFGVGGTGRCT